MDLLTYLANALGATIFYFVILWVVYIGGGHAVTVILDLYRNRQR